MADIYAIRPAEPEALVVSTSKDGVLRLDLNNPPANTLSMALMGELQDALDGAAIGGVATAAGCQLGATCDLAIASETARVGGNGRAVDLFGSILGVALARKVPRKAAMEMLLTGEIIDAQTARGFGLVNRVVPPEYLDQTAMKFAATIAAKSPSAVRIGKEAFYRQAEMGLVDAYDYAAGIMTENMLFDDAEEGIDAFIEKRKPEWRGK